jgi:hypothetical protein
MNTVALKTPSVITAVTDFLSSDFLQEEIQTLPNDLQEIFDLVLDTDAGNCLQTRRKMLRIKELAVKFARTLAPFSENDIEESSKKHQI